MTLAQIIVVLVGAVVLVLGIAYLLIGVLGEQIKQVSRQIEQLTVRLAGRLDGLEAGEVGLAEVRSDVRSGT